MDTALTRERLPDTREGETARLTLGPHKLFATLNKYDDGRPAELFVTLAGESGGELGAWVNATAQAMSIAVQYGAPLRAFVSHWRGVRSDAAGFCGDGEFRSATSTIDLLAQWLERSCGEYATGASLPPPVNGVACDAPVPTVPTADGPSVGAAWAKVTP